MEHTEGLKPPPGYDSWLDYAVHAMETRDLFNAQCDDDSHWGRLVQREEMRQAARDELKALRSTD